MGKTITAYWESKREPVQLFGTPINPLSGQYHAFVPDPIRALRPRLSADTYTHLEDASRALVELQNRFSTSALAPLRSLGAEIDALGSSAIENLPLSYANFAQSLLLGPRGSERKRLAIGNLSAIDTAVRAARRESVTVDTLGDIHRALLAGTKQDSIAGQLRTSIVWIGGMSPPTARYVPPPPQYVPALLGDLAQFMNRTDLPVVLQAALAHAQYEAIHPCVDGNGRSGRALVHTIFARHELGATATPFSAALWRRRPDYYEQLDHYRYGDLDSWCSFFAKAVTQSAGELGGDGPASLSSRALALAGEYQAKLGGARAGSALARLLPHLIGAPYLNLRQAQYLTGASPEATRLALEQLQTAGITTLQPRVGRGHLWALPGVHQLVEPLLASFRLGAPAERALD